MYAIFEDNHNNLWVGTEGGGISKYDGKYFTHYTEKEGLSDNSVYAILEDHNSNLWFGTNGGGVSRYDGDIFRHYTEKEGLSHHIVRSILEDQSGNLWLGSYGGISKYDGKSFALSRQEEKLFLEALLKNTEELDGSIRKVVERSEKIINEDTTFNILGIN